MTVSNELRQIKVLLIEDNDDDAYLIKRYLSSEFIVICEQVNDKSLLHSLVTEKEWDIIISDFNLEGFNGLDALNIINNSGADIPFILASAVIGEETAVLAMKAGARDYIRKDNLPRLLPAVKRELEAAELRKKEKESLRLLKESEERFRASIENMIDAFIVLHPVKGHSAEEIIDYRITYINQTGADKFGSSKDAIIDKHITMFFPTLHERPVFGKLNKLYFEGGTFVDEEFRAKSNFDGSEVVFDIRGVKLPIGIGITWRDITENKKKEERLKQLNEDKDKFFSIIAHDLRSPFSSILGLTEILAEEVDILTRDEIKTFAMGLYKSSKNVFQLMENLLQWSRLETGKIDFEPKSFDIQNLTEKIINLYYTSSHSKDITVLNRIAEKTMVYADKNMIESVLRNLFSNAIKFTNAGGEISFSSEIKDEFIQITVSDSGIGMPADDIKRIMDEGFSRTTPGTDNEKGSGLGLVLVKEFISKNRGSFEVKSKPGDGSQFILTLPSKSPELTTA